MIGPIRWHRAFPGGIARRIRAGILVVLAGLMQVHSPASAQSLTELIQTAPMGEPLALPAGKTVGRADIGGRTVILGGGEATLSAPEDDAVLVVLPGADLRVSGVDFVQEGVSKFAVYVDGGSLHLDGCHISGGFEVAVYVASGNLKISDCQIIGGLYGIQAAPGSTVVIDSVDMQGQGDTAIRADGSTLSLIDVTVADSGKNGVIVISSTEFLADGLTVSGIISDAVWVQDGILTDLRRVVAQVSGRALTSSGGGDFRMEGFLLSGNGGALALSGLSGSVAVAHGRLQSSGGATTASLSDAASVTMNDVEMFGGETGLYLSGSLPDTVFERVLLHSQTGTGLFADAVARPPEALPLKFLDLRIISAGSSLPAFFRDSGPVTFTRSALLTTGTWPIGREGASTPVFQQSALISAPEFSLGHIAYEVEPGERPRFLPVGDVAPLDGEMMSAGSVAMTVADFAGRVGIDTSLRRAVADFAAGRNDQPGILALALEFAIPDASTHAVISDLIELELAPPEDGWVWDKDAVRISLTAADGRLHNAVPGDFPLTLPAGSYGLAVDGQPAGRIGVSAGSTLEVVLPDAPFYAWRDGDGRKVRGPALYLRPREELLGLLNGFRPLRPGEFWGYAPAFAARRGADRQAAVAFITQSKADIPAILAEIVQLDASENWPEFNRRWQRIDMSLDVMAQFGSRDDARWLLDLAIPPDLQIDNMETAVLIEMRLNALGDGAALPLARNRVAAYLAQDSAPFGDTFRLVTALGRSGLAEGTALLAVFHAAQRSKTDTGLPTLTAVIEMARLPPEIAGSIPTAFLDAMALTVAKYLEGPLPEGSAAPIGNGLWNAAAAALAHEVAHAPPGSVQRRLAIPLDANIGPSAWLFQDPIVMMRGALAQIGPTDPQRLNGWQYRIPEYLCTALAYRTPAERARLLAELREEVIFAVAVAFVPEDEDKSDPDIMAKQYANVTFALDLMLGECVLSDPVLQNFGRNAIGEEQAIFDNLDYEPLWWVRMPRARANLEYFGRGEEYPDFRGLSAYPQPELAAILATATAADPALRDTFLARHRLISDAFQSDYDYLNFGAEHRQFRLRNEAGNGSVTIAGYLDIRPILDDGRLIIAVRHRIESPDYGGLAAMITQPDRAPFEADNRIRMFEAVTLDKGGVETAMRHEGTSAEGILYFAAPWSGDLSDTVLHLNMRFWDATWDIDLPLWASSLAFGQRARAGATEDGP